MRLNAENNAVVSYQERQCAPGQLYSILFCFVLFYFSSGGWVKIKHDPMFQAVSADLHTRTNNTMQYIVSGTRHDADDVVQTAQNHEFILVLL